MSKSDQGPSKRRNKLPEGVVINKIGWITTYREHINWRDRWQKEILGNNEGEPKNKIPS